MMDKPVLTHGGTPPSETFLSRNGKSQRVSPALQQFAFGRLAFTEGPFPPSTN